MASAISVWHKVLMNSGIVESQDGEPVARVRFKCFNADHYQLVKDLMGTSIRAGPSIIRTFPFPYPPSPNLICLAIESIEFHGHGWQIPGLSSVWISREFAYVTARFGLAKFSLDGTNDPSGKPYTTTTFHTSGEFLSLPGTTYVFPSGKRTDQPVGRFMPQMEISMKRWMLPYEPLAEVGALTGKVNDAAYVIGSFTAATGTLLFPGGEVEISCDTTGAILYDCTYKFLYRPIPWNQFLSPDPSEGWQVITDGNSDPVYESGDFTTLP